MVGERQNEEDRGRYADKPRKLGRKGWRDVAVRVKREVSDDNMSIVAGGVAFFGFLAIFPAIAAFVSLYGLVMDPADARQQVESLRGTVPPQMIEVLSMQLSRVAGASGLGWGVVLGIVVSLWSANKGMKALISGVNIAFDEHETRGFFKLNATALAMTIGAMVLGIVAIALVAVLPAVLGHLGLGQAGQLAVRLARWPLLAVGLTLVLACVYRYGPDRQRPKWRWTTWGAGVATLLWILASIAFSFYSSNFGSYDKTYGAVGAVVVLMMWLFVSSYVVLLGAELDSEMERQTRLDTTVGEPDPMGKRRAYAADTLGERTQ